MIQQLRLCLIYIKYNLKCKIMKDFTLRKRFLDSKRGTSSLFKGFVMLVVLMLMTTSSAMAEVIDGLRYVLDPVKKTATLLPKMEGKYSGDIIIPEKVKGNDGVEYVVTSLGASCFEGCSGLTSITIPSSVTSLSESCFKGCSGLTSITIPSSITSLGESCFSGCRGLTSITIPSSITSLGKECFYVCAALTSITIPSSVTSLGASCFWECRGLTSITIPSSVTSLGENCFAYCTSLTSITIPSSIISFSWGCFYGCSGLETVYFKGKKCNSNYAYLKIPTISIIMVPTEYLQGYKDAFGPDYKYIYAWNPDETGDDNKPVTQCSTPSISYESGELKFASETAGAEYHYTITDADMASDAYSKEGKVTLSAAYNISVYATADGYKASDKAEATLYWINANLDNSTNINMVKTRGVVASAHDGIITLSGLDNGEVVKFYATDGKLVGSSSAVDGTASCAVSDTMVIAKFGDNAIKVAVK